MSQTIYLEGERAMWLAKLEEAGVRYRAELSFTQLAGLVALRKEAKAAMVKEAKRHPAFALLTSIPGLGPVRVAQLVAILDTPHRFRSKRALWAYAGLAVVRQASAEYRIEGDRVRRVTKAGSTRGLNQNGNRRVKEVFKGAANTACAKEPFAAFYKQVVARGLKPSVARVSLARKIASVVLAVWKSGKEFDAKKLTASTT
jgi:transposase